MATNEQGVSIWESYSRAWSPISDEQRTALLAASLHPDVRYRDPNGSLQGREEVAYMAGTQARMPRVSFSNQSVSQHNDRLLAPWLMISGDGAVIAPGVSFARFEGEWRVEMNGLFPTPGVQP